MYKEIAWQVAIAFGLLLDMYVDDSYCPEATSDTRSGRT